MKQKYKTKLVLILAVILFLLVGLYVFLRYLSPDNSSRPPSDQHSGEKINLDPPTESELRQTELNKDNLVARDEKLKEAQNKSDGQSKKTVTPVITYLGQYGANIEIGGYVNDAYEDDGVCEVIYSKDSARIIKSVPAVKNNSSVDCPAIITPVTDFPQVGKWAAVLNYTSSSSTGSSVKKDIEVR